VTFSARKRADEERDATVRMLNLIITAHYSDVLMREVTLRCANGRDVCPWASG